MDCMGLHQRYVKVLGAVLRSIIVMGKAIVIEVLGIGRGIGSKKRIRVASFSEMMIPNTDFVTVKTHRWIGYKPVVWYGTIVGPWFIRSMNPEFVHGQILGTVSSGCGSE
jgi:hypothetical protein